MTLAMRPSCIIVGNRGHTGCTIPRVADRLEILMTARLQSRLVTRSLFVALLFLLMAGMPLEAQTGYFGQNRVQYQTFNFQVLPTEHFDIYYYPEKEEAARLAARMAERWYARLSRC
jgi:hypothetical protein